MLVWVTGCLVLVPWLVMAEIDWENVNLTAKKLPENFKDAEKVVIEQKYENILGVNTFYQVRFGLVI